MKMLIYPFFIIFALCMSCSVTKEENYSKQFENYYKKNMHDPSSFELVDVHVLPGYMIHTENVEFYKERLEDKNNGKINLKELDSLLDLRLSNQNSVIFKIRGKNSFGANILSNVNAYFIDGKLKYVEGKKIY